MKKYTQPDANVIYMNGADVIATSTLSVSRTAGDCGYTPWDDLFIGI